MKTLITTIGPDPENTMAAMRDLPYEKLILVVAEGNEDMPGLIKIKQSEEKTKGLVEIISVDEFDLKDCFRKIVEYVTEQKETAKNIKRKSRIDVTTINVSGGSKIMGDAALLAAVHLGIPAFYCDKSRMIRMPVIQGVSLRDRFTESQIMVLKEMGTRETIEGLSGKLSGRLTPDTIKKSLRRMKKMGVIRSFASEGRVVTELTESGIFVLETLNRFDRTIMKKG